MRAVLLLLWLWLWSACRMPWQRLLSLQVLRWLMSDPQLLYALFSTYDMSIHHDVNAVHDTLQVALEIVKVRCCKTQLDSYKLGHVRGVLHCFHVHELGWLLCCLCWLAALSAPCSPTSPHRTCNIGQYYASHSCYRHIHTVQAYVKQSDASEEDLMERLSSIYRGKADGKELQIDVDSAVVVQSATQEVRRLLLHDHACQQAVSYIQPVCMCMCACWCCSSHGTFVTWQIDVDSAIVVQAAMQQVRSARQPLLHGQEQQHVECIQPCACICGSSSMVVVLLIPMDSSDGTSVTWLLMLMLQAWVAYLALDMLLSVVACVETLADAVASTNGSACSEQLQLAPLVTSSSEHCRELQ
jgi:hypothetical protein